MEFSKENILIALKIVIVINRSSGELEWIAPIIVRLLDEGHGVDLLFLRQRELEYFYKTELLFELLKSKGAKIILYYSKNSLLLGRIIQKYVYQFRNFFKGASNNRKSFEYEINSFDIQRVIETKGLCSNPDLLIVDNSYYIDLKKTHFDSFYHCFLNAIEFQSLLLYPHAPIVDDEKSSNSVRMNSQDSFLDANQDSNDFFNRQYPDYAKRTWMITDSISKAKMYSNNRGLKTFYVQSPRYQKSWINKINIQPNKLLDDKNKVLILSKLQGIVFKQNKFVQPIELIKDIVKACESKKIPWVIKPHPRDDISLLNKIVENHSSQKHEDSFLYGDFASIKNSFSVCIALPTSAILDTILYGIPTVEYFPSQNETKPINYSSPYFNVDLVLASHSKAEVESFVEKFKDGKYCEEVIRKQQSRLISLFSDGIDPFDAVKKILQTC